MSWHVNTAVRTWLGLIRVAVQRAIDSILTDELVRILTSVKNKTSSVEKVILLAESAVMNCENYSEWKKQTPLLMVFVLGRMCFNRLGDFTCIDTPCPVSFKRNEKNGFCVKQCPPGSNCSNRPISAIEYKTIGKFWTWSTHANSI